MGAESRSPTCRSGVLSDAGDFRLCRLGYNDTYTHTHTMYGLSYLTCLLSTLDYLPPYIKHAYIYMYFGGQEPCYDIIRIPNKEA